MHMLADAADALGRFSDFPAAFALCAVGFFLVLGLDRLPTHSETTSSLILALVLSVHSFIAGTAVGLETHFWAATILMMALVAHKGSAAFALGVRLAQSGTSAGFRTIAIFALTTPLGVLAGVVLSHWLQGRAAELTEGIFDALAGGTFLYVAIMEVLAPEFASKQSQVPKYALALAGFTLMSVLALRS